MKKPLLDYYMHDGPAAFRFELSGTLDRDGARRLDQDWRTASSVIGGRSLIVDITFVTGAGEEGRALLARWYDDGAEFIANSRSSRALAESIIGRPLPAPAKTRAALSRRTWVPFHALLILLAALILPSSVQGATLKSETVGAWEDYVHVANVTLQNRIRPNGSFLWTFENADRAAKVRSGEIVVAPASAQNPRKAPGGLIHHWIGAMFVPNVKLDQMLDVTRDYDRYQEFYRPYVMESKTVASNGVNDRFSMLLLNRALFMKTALEADYQAANIRLDDRRFYSVSRTTRVQEVEDYGQAGQHRIPEGEGGGYIWKLHSISRFEQRDGGVYVELEAIALSRDIPAIAHFVVDPIVRRVSRNSLLLSLQQTQEAVRGVTVAKSDNIPSIAEPRSMRRSVTPSGSAFTSVH